MTKILLVQGANLTFLGRREPDIYGTTTPAELDARLQRGHFLAVLPSHVVRNIFRNSLPRSVAETLRNM